MPICSSSWAWASTAGFARRVHCGSEGRCGARTCRFGISQTGWVASLHPTAWKEVEAMARTAGKELKIDLRPAIETLGLEYVLEQVGIERLLEQAGVDR